MTDAHLDTDGDDQPETLLSRLGVDLRTHEQGCELLRKLLDVAEDYGEVKPAAHLALMLDDAWTRLLQDTFETLEQFEAIFAATEHDEEAGEE